jgi:hypothetical protein
VVPEPHPGRRSARRRDGHVPHRVRSHRLSGRDRAEGGVWRRSTTRSVVFDTSGGWLELSNELQSTGMRPDVKIGLIAVAGCCSIGADQT